MGTYGYRFSEKSGPPLYQLFAVGHERVGTADYCWDGMKRTDGPLYLFQYTLSGRGCLRMRDKVYEIRAGEAILAEIPGDHTYYLPPDSPEWEFYFVLVRPDQLRDMWRETEERLGCRASFPIDSAPVRALETIYREARLDRIADAYRASSLVYQFMAELCRYAMSARRNDRHQWPEAIRAAMSFIERRYADHISVEQIAQAAGMSKYHLIRSFAKATGHTPVEVMTRLRLKQSVDLLLHTDLPVEEIATTCGYSSGSYFIKVFKRHIGCPPGEFRSGKDMLPVNRLTID